MDLNITEDIDLSNIFIWYGYMQDDYVYMQDDYVYMQDNYVYMQDNSNL